MLKRTTPSEVEQKLLDPDWLLTGVPTTTYSPHFCFCFAQPPVVKRNPDFSHQLPAVQVALPSVASMKRAWAAVDMTAPPGSGPRAARSRA